MAARVTVLAGRVGAGKTAELLRRIRAAVQEGKQALLLVPEQYTYDAERMLLETLGGAAFHAEALGFSRLCERVLEEAGGGARLFLSPEGRRMALRGVLDEKRGSLKLYGGVSARSGFFGARGRSHRCVQGGRPAARGAVFGGGAREGPAALRKTAGAWHDLRRTAGAHGRQIRRRCRQAAPAHRKTAAVRFVQRNGGVRALAPRLFVRRALLRHFLLRSCRPPAA